MNQNTIQFFANVLDSIEDDLIKTTVEVRKLRYLFEAEIKDEEDQYCEVSGAKLGKECQHEAENQTHVFTDKGGSFGMNKCLKCGEFYK